MPETALPGLVRLVDALLDSGVSVTGDVTIGVADVDLVAVNLRVLLTGVQAQLDRGGARPQERAGRAGRAEPLQLPALEPLPARIDGDPDRGDAGLGRLVLVLAQLLYQVLEHQAVARLDGGSLTPTQEERLGRALLAMDTRLGQLRELLMQPPKVAEVPEEVGRFSA